MDRLRALAIAAGLLLAGAGGALGLYSAAPSPSPSSSGGEPVFVGHYREARGRLGREGQPVETSGGGGCASPLCTDLVSYYPFDTDSSDSVGPNDGTDTAISYASAGKIGNAAVGTNSATSKIDLGVGSGLNLTGDFCISAWINTPSSTYWFVLFRGTGSGGTENTYELRINSSNALEFTATSGNGSVAGGTVSTGAWHHIVASNSGTTVTIYVDGSSVGSATVHSRSDLPSAHTLVGTRGDGFTHMEPKIDELYIRSAPCSAGNVTELYNSGNGKAYPFN